MIKPVILCGGSGSRLWPLSREGYPKQFLALHGERTLLQETLTRVANLPKMLDPMCICNVKHRFIVAQQMRSMKIVGEIILEPVGRNTAPAITVAALRSQEQDPLLLVLPSDHYIYPQTEIASALAKAIPLAEEGGLVAFGINPIRPESGFGYIRSGQAYGQGFQIKAFVEKPDAAQAAAMLAVGGHFWNSGMFLFKASTLLHEMERFKPDIVAACRHAVMKSVTDLDFVRLDRDSFEACPADSVDYAVLEKTDHGMLVPMMVQWNDLGSWSSLHEIGNKDVANNVICGDVVVKDSFGCYLHSNDKLLAVVGVKDIVAVVADDAVLIAHKDKTQQVKEIVAQLKKTKRSEAVIHKKVYRPWGTYETTDVAERFQVKRITVNPGGVLSLQKHHHRAEHWVVVRGTAQIINGDKQFLLQEGQSTYIQLGAMHRLENPGKIPLDIIEVQTGSYLGEDDIVRNDDVYNRNSE